MKNRYTFVKFVIAFVLADVMLLLGHPWLALIVFLGVVLGY